jgi:hypothetical protein
VPCFFFTLIATLVFPRLLLSALPAIRLHMSAGSAPLFLRIRVLNGFGCDKGRLLADDATLRGLLHLQV